MPTPVPYHTARSNGRPRLTILFVDGDVITRAFIGQTLKLNGGWDVDVEVHDASTIDEGISLLRSQESSVDMVIASHRVLQRKDLKGDGVLFLDFVERNHPQAFRVLLLEDQRPPKETSAHKILTKPVEQGSIIAALAEARKQKTKA